MRSSTPKTKTTRLYEALGKNPVRGLDINQATARCGFSSAQSTRSVIRKRPDIESFTPKTGTRLRYRLSA